jgi:hypothetical protein
MPAKAMPEAKLPDEWAATGRVPIRARLLAIQFSAPSSLNDPDGVQP